jgi:hypothetical protein
LGDPRMQLEKRIRDLAMFNLAIDSKLRGCDLVTLRVVVFPILVYGALSSPDLAQWLVDTHLRTFGEERLKGIVEGGALKGAGKDVGINFDLLLTTGGEVFRLIYPGSGSTARAVFLIGVVPITFLLLASIILAARDVCSETGEHCAQPTAQRLDLGPASPDGLWRRYSGGDGGRGAHGAGRLLKAVCCDTGRNCERTCRYERCCGRQVHFEAARRDQSLRLPRMAARRERLQNISPGRN